MGCPCPSQPGFAFWGNSGLVEARNRNGNVLTAKHANHANEEGEATAAGNKKGKDVDANWHEAGDRHQGEFFLPRYLSDASFAPPGLDGFGESGPRAASLRSLPWAIIFRPGGADGRWEAGEAKAEG